MSQYSKTPSLSIASTLTKDHCGIGEVAIPILGVGIDEYNNAWPSGTAVVVAPWLAMTAKHVVEDYLGKFGATQATNGLDPKFQLLTCLTLEGDRGVIPLFIGRIWYCNSIDIAFFELLPASEFPLNHIWKVAILDLLPPSVGDRVVAFGYSDSSVRDGTNSVDLLTWSNKPSTSVGEVLEVHHQSRDSARLHFPCFRTNARFDGGMSGGPVFNDAGLVCGIVCSSIPATLEEDGHISYASSLWMAMGILVNANCDRHPPGVYYTVHELAEAGILSVKGLDCLEVRRSTEDIQIVALKHPP